MTTANISRDQLDGVFQVIEDAKTYSIKFAVSSVLEVMDFLLLKGEEVFQSFWNRVQEVIEYVDEKSGR